MGWEREAESACTLKKRDGGRIEQFKVRDERLQSHRVVEGCPVRGFLCMKVGLQGTWYEVIRAEVTQGLG